ncbi:hypothetical protein AOLI_G00213500 [Acnodon oligacanthus]
MCLVEEDGQGRRELQVTFITSLEGRSCARLMSEITAASPEISQQDLGLIYEELSAPSMGLELRERRRSLFSMLFAAPRSTKDKCRHLVL